MEKTVTYAKRERQFHAVVASTFPKLDEFKKKEDSISFSKELLKILPEVKRYVARRLQTALNKRVIDKNKFKPEDFIDQLFIEVYDHFDEVTDANELHPWLFKKADELVEDTLLEEEFDTLFFDNIDDYSTSEWDAMEEKFSTDGDGDLVMLEELDDISYRTKTYVLKNIFLEDERENMMARLDKDLEAKAVQKHVDMVRYQLPTSMQAVFELYTEHQFDLPEIARIRNSTLDEVQKLLSGARARLRTSFLNRFDIGTP